MKVTIELDNDIITKIALNKDDKLEEITDYIKSLCNALCEEPIGTKTEVET